MYDPIGANHVSLSDQCRASEAGDLNLVVLEHLRGDDLATRGLVLLPGDSPCKERSGNDVSLQDGGQHRFVL